MFKFWLWDACDQVDRIHVSSDFPAGLSLKPLVRRPCAPSGRWQSWLEPLRLESKLSDSCRIWVGNGMACPILEYGTSDICILYTFFRNPMSILIHIIYIYIINLYIQTKKLYQSCSLLFEGVIASLASDLMPRVPQRWRLVVKDWRLYCFKTIALWSICGNQSHRPILEPLMATPWKLTPLRSNNWEKRMVSSLHCVNNSLPQS